jgi:hypothetical protein
MPVIISPLIYGDCVLAVKNTPAVDEILTKCTLISVINTISNKGFSPSSILIRNGTI